MQQTIGTIFTYGLGGLGILSALSTGGLVAWAIVAMIRGFINGICPKDE
jgi:hypothetical protein